MSMLADCSCDASLAVATYEEEQMPVGSATVAELAAGQTRGATQILAPCDHSSAHLQPASRRRFC